MTVSYHCRKDRLAPYYGCAGRKESDQVMHGVCQHIGGGNIDQAIGDLLVEVVNPLALEVALAVRSELEARWEETDRLRRTQVDRARYEAELARRPFSAWILITAWSQLLWNRTGIKSFACSPKPNNIMSASAIIGAWIRTNANRFFP